ncbi:MAG: ribose-phosphate pyrophosphokinase [Longimicrobiales bacterium]
MREPLLLALPGNERFVAGLAAELPGEIGRLTVRHFPDGETYVRVDTPVEGRDVILICTLHRPDDKILALLFVAAATAELGATRMGLVTPYLAYMRQDRRFQEGEGVTSTYFAGLLSRAVDWVVTVDPHLHRRGALSDIYSVPTSVIHAAPAVAEWIRANVERPLLVGPDAESEQWVRAVAEAAAMPHVVLEKVRRGDYDVEVSVPNVEEWRAHTPVLVDDIISTARTMIETVGHLTRAGLASPVCVGVHAVFAKGALEALLAAGAGKVVTTNTIAHATNAIDITGLVVDSVRTMREQAPTRAIRVAAGPVP